MKIVVSRPGPIQTLGRLYSSDLRPPIDASGSRASFWLD